MQKLNLPDPRNVGTPLSADMPAPVMATTRFALLTIASNDFRHEESCILKFSATDFIFKNKKNWRFFCYMQAKRKTTDMC